MLSIGQVIDPWSSINDQFEMIAAFFTFDAWLTAHNKLLRKAISQDG
jgi:hypothetical protein